MGVRGGSCWKALFVQDVPGYRLKLQVAAPTASGSPREASRSIAALAFRTQQRGRGGSGLECC